MRVHLEQKKRGKPLADKKPNKLILSLNYRWIYGILKPCERSLDCSVKFIKNFSYNAMNLSFS